MLLKFVFDSVCLSALLGQRDIISANILQIDVVRRLSSAALAILLANSSPISFS